MPINFENLPDKLRLFIFDETSHQPVTGIPVRLHIELEEYSYVSGILSSDHVGYVSFDLTRIPDPNDEYGHVTNLYVQPMLGIDYRVDVLETLESLTDDFLSIPIFLDITELPERYSVNELPSVITPDAIDWQLSPLSFGSKEMTILGEDGCEVLWPSQATEEIYKFHQLARIPTIEDEVLSPISDDEELPAIRIRRGKLLMYETVWKPINHGLGRLLHSLTLAPCEHTNIAVIDWSREDLSQRSEETQLSEQLLHDLRRDRVVQEAVEATLAEWQSGESFMGGTGGVGGGGWQPYWSVTGSHSVGYTTASTEGRRHAESNTVQRIADKIAQASSMLRNLRSTVVVQASQAEREHLQTRTVRNHNHCHALSILYYEVVRNYLVQTRFWAEQEVLFIDYMPPLEFDEATVKQHARVLRENLLDKDLEPAFDLLKEPLRDEEAELELLENGTITRFIVRITMGEDALDEDAKRRIRLLVMKENGSIEGSSFAAAVANHLPTDFELFRESNADRTIVNTIVFNLPERDSGAAARPTRMWQMALSEIHEVGLVLQVSGSGEARERAHFAQVEIRAVISLWWSSTIVDILRSTVPDFEEDTEWWSTPNLRPNIELMRSRLQEKRDTIGSLINHLNANSVYYNTAIKLAESPIERAIRFENYRFTTETHEGRLADFIDNEPLGLFGNYVAFRVGPILPYRPSPDDDVLEADERVVSLPTRGAFAETKLSNCSACEEIDDTRFWDWQQSPCGDTAADVTDLSSGSRFQDLASAVTGLPSSISVEGPPGAPDPSALTAVMQLMGQTGVFNDISGVSQLKELLVKLVEVAGAVEQERLSQKKEDEEGGGDKNVDDENGDGANGNGDNNNKNGPH